MAPPVLPVPEGRSASRSPRMQKSRNPLRKDKVRQGKLIRSWTDEEESFLFRSRTQGQKLPYKHIANRLDKTELACRVHWHHMTVGRKGHRAEEYDDDNISDNSDGSAPPTVPSSSQFVTHGSSSNAQQEANLPHPTSPKPCTLPSFETFIRDTFHQRSTSSPGSLVGDDVDNGARETQLPNSNRSLRTLSGSWLRDAGATSTYLEPQGL
ncbi:hypothetical protein AYL99_00132 [Fonsecaea erecta]|uniref:Myb-like domain-containing protein n=1 Tax=Fonsecaea erecta TaxID=1367422 RepID=A0A178ZWF9_9EURO|nr:hypothetical protein AYL99_00132 [Fonsecaea erecta]OAP64160.1 hypothetical protein AYL99_00132 [Fonsecaea erecta]